MASPLFKLSSDGGATFAPVGAALADARALAYAGSGSFACKAILDSTSGVEQCSWRFTSADDLHNGSLPPITPNDGEKSCTFSIPKQGGAWILEALVNNRLRARLALKVLNAQGQQELAVGETTEAGAMGWTKAHNDVARAEGGGGGGGGGTLAGDVTGPTGATVVSRLKTVPLEESFEDAADSPGRLMVSTPTGSVGLTATPSDQAQTLLWDPTNEEFQLGLGRVCVVYRVGFGGNVPGVYTSFADAFAAAQSIPGIVDLVIDASDDYPSPEAGVYDCEQRIRLIGRPAAGAPVIGIDCSGGSGVVFKNACYCENLRFDGVISATVFQQSLGSPLDLELVRCTRNEFGGHTADFFQLRNGTNKLRLRGGTVLEADSRTLATTLDGVDLEVYVEDGSVNNECFYGDEGTLTAYLYPAASWVEQAGFSNVYRAVPMLGATSENTVVTNAGGTITLTDQQAACTALRLYGTPATDCTVVFPVIPGREWVVRNEQELPCSTIVWAMLSGSSRKIYLPPGAVRRLTSIASDLEDDAGGQAIVHQRQISLVGLAGTVDLIACKIPAGVDVRRLLAYVDAAVVGGGVTISCGTAAGGTQLLKALAVSTLGTVRGVDPTNEWGTDFGTVGSHTYTADTQIYFRITRAATITAGSLTLTLEGLRLIR